MFKVSVSNAGSTGGALELLLYGDIGESFFDEGITAKRLAEAIAGHPKIRTLNVRINSEGGNALEGFNIYNLLRRQERAGKTVNTFVDAAALSAASVVMLGGGTVEAAENSIIMIHEPHSMVRGGADELRKRADLLDAVGVNIADTYAGRAFGVDSAGFRAMMREETWFSAQQALEIGLVDIVGTPLDIAAKFNPARFEHAPEWALARRTGPPADRKPALAAMAHRVSHLS